MIGHVWHVGADPRSWLATERLGRDFATRDNVPVGAHRSVLTACCGKRETYHHLHISLYLRWILGSEQTDPRLFSLAPLRKWRTYSLQTERRTGYNFFSFLLLSVRVLTFTVFIFIFCLLLRSIDTRPVQWRTTSTRTLFSATTPRREFWCPSSRPPR